MQTPKLADNTWKTIKDQPIELAVLPWGATEAHNFHLPYGTDNYQIEAISIHAAKEANARGAQVIVLPTIPFGVNTGQSGIKLTINMHPSTQAKVLHDVVESLNNQGIDKLLIMNGHGGNDFKQIIREINYHFPKMFICTSLWFKLPEKHDFFTVPGDHADESETSLMLHLKPELVLPLNEAGDGKSKQFKIKALNESWAWAERQWLEITEDTGVGNPHAATAGKGKVFFDHLVKRYSDLMLELAKTSRQDIYG